MTNDRPPTQHKNEHETTGEGAGNQAAALADLSAGPRRRIGSSLHSTRISANWHFAGGFRRLAAWPCSASARKIRNTF